MRILLVEDDRSLLRAVTSVLRDESYEVDQAENGEDGLLLAETGTYDLLVLDVMMPGLDGFSLIKTLRKGGIVTPAIFLTAKDSVDARVKGLDAGADDYLVKPFAVEELLARIRALLRRDGKLGGEGDLAYAAITLPANEHDAFVDGQALRLTSKEYELLTYLVRNREQILPRGQIFDRVWGVESETTENVVDVYVHYLRKKLAPHGLETLIRTVRGVGYMLKEDKGHVPKNASAPGRA